MLHTTRPIGRFQVHKEADEGMAIVNAIRREPADQVSKPKTADMHGSLMIWISCASVGVIGRPHNQREAGASEK